MAKVLVSIQGLIEQLEELNEQGYDYVEIDVIGTDDKHSNNLRLLPIDNEEESEDWE